MNKTLLIIEESDIAVIDYSTDEFRLINGDCYAQVPYMTDECVQRRGWGRFYKTGALVTEGEFYGNRRTTAQTGDSNG